MQLDESHDKNSSMRRMAKRGGGSKKNPFSSFASPNAHMFAEKPGDDYPSVLGSVLRKQLADAEFQRVDASKPNENLPPKKAAPHIDWKQYSKAKKNNQT